MKRIGYNSFLLSVIITIILSIGGCGPSGKGTPVTYQKVFSVGETATFDRQAFTVKKVERNYTPGPTQYYTPKVPAGKEWVVASIKIENNAKHAFTFHKENIFVEDASKTIYRGSPLSPDLQRPGFIPMGDWLQGGLMYEVPQGTKGLTLYYQPRYLQKKNQIIVFKLG